MKTMNLKKILIGLALVIVICMYAIWNHEKNKPEVIQIKPLLPIQQDISVGKIVPPPHPLPSPTSTVNVYSTTPPHNMEKDLVATEVVNELFSIAVLSKDGVHKNIDQRISETIEVYNFYDHELEKSHFMPLYIDNTVAGIVIYREYKQGLMELGEVGRIETLWTTYPPIPFDAAEFVLNNHDPSIVYTPILGYYYIEGGNTPYYLFESSDPVVSTQYYLVSAYDKQIIIRDDRNSRKDEEPKPPIKMTKEGLMVLDLPRLSQKSKEELTQMQQDVDLVNQYIKDGLLGIDENLNTVFDKRDATSYSTLEERNRGGRNTDMPLTDTTTYEWDRTTHEHGQYEGKEVDLSSP